MSGEQMSLENKCPENKCHWRTNVRRTNVIGEQMSGEQMSLENKCPRTNVIGEQMSLVKLEQMSENKCPENKCLGEQMSSTQLEVEIGAIQLRRSICLYSSLPNTRPRSAIKFTEKFLPGRPYLIQVVY